MELDIMNFNNNLYEKKTSSISSGGSGGKPATVQIRGASTSSKDLKLRKKTVIPFIIAFFFLSFVGATIVNLYTMAQNMDNNHFFSIDIRANTSREAVEELEKEILGIHGVKSVRYVSKDQSFRELQEQLEIAIPESENSLSDSMTVYIRSKSDLNNLQERIESMEEVREFYVDTVHIEFREERSKFYRLLIVVILGTLFIPTLFLIGFIFYNGFLIDFANSYNTAANDKIARRKGKISGIVHLLFSMIIGHLLFLNGYVYLGNLLVLNVGESYKLMQLSEFMFLQIIVNVVFCILVIVTPLWPSKISGGES